VPQEEPQPGRRGHRHHPAEHHDQAGDGPHDIARLVGPGRTERACRGAQGRPAHHVRAHVEPVQDDLADRHAEQARQDHAGHGHTGGSAEVPGRHNRERRRDRARQKTLRKPGRQREKTTERPGGPEADGHRCRHPRGQGERIAPEDLAPLMNGPRVGDRGRTQHPHEKPRVAAVGRARDAAQPQEHEEHGRREEHRREPDPATAGVNLFGHAVARERRQKKETRDERRHGDAPPSDDRACRRLSQRSVRSVTKAVPTNTARVPRTTSATMGRPWLSRSGPY
jgi:hypothetical protein